MTLHLSDDDHEALVEVLEREIPTLRHEIHHTDNHDYRDFLKGRERLPEKMLVSMKAQSATELWDHAV